MMTRLIKRSLLFLALVSLMMPAFVRSASVQAVSTDDKVTEADPQYAMDWRVTGPSGGDVRALVVDPNDAQRFYFGTLDGQIYTSTDGGQSWRLLHNFNRPQLFVDHIIVDPRDSRVIYVATHKHKEAGGFYKTADGGQTWREAAALKEEALHSMTQSAQKPNSLILGSNRGLCLSTNAGGSLEQIHAAATSR